MEIGFRKVIVQSLGMLTRRRKRLPTGIDFNQCKFLFIRQDRIGDVLVSTPLFVLLKKHYPNAVLDVLLSKNNHFVLDHETLIRKRWVYTKRFASSLRNLADIRSERYDFVIDLMDNPSATSTVVALLAGGTWNVGIDKDNRYAYDVVVPMLSRRDTHIVDRLAQLLTVFGIDPTREHLQIRYSVSPQAENVVSTFERNHALKKRPIVGINISAGSDARYWGARNYQNLLQLIQRNIKSHAVVVLCKSEDRDRAREIIKSSPDAIMAPELSFDEFAALIRRLHVLVTPDTSAVHLASAFHIPSVVLYVQSDSNLRIWEPYRTPCEPIVTKVDDLSAIPVSQVFEGLQRLLGNVPKARAGKSSGIAERV
ncbi:MAG: glycosyltransferase family 9 protein [Ignavibacteriales bacterium]|nr:glycosyltransferase family 9 protein [Ignavibacteriales bacterium]